MAIDPYGATDEGVRRERRRHEGRAAAADDEGMAALEHNLSDNPTLADQLSPSQRIALGLYRNALESQQWLDTHTED